MIFAGPLCFRRLINAFNEEARDVLIWRHPQRTCYAGSLIFREKTNPYNEAKTLFLEEDLLCLRKVKFRRFAEEHSY